ncbi:MAG: hypothetical protein GX237_01880, partial [Clostridiales bacterium]|nr:hypothetical protein [Clostridiales bacterium]
DGQDTIIEDNLGDNQDNSYQEDEETQGNQIISDEEFPWENFWDPNWDDEEFEDD